MKKLHFLCYVLLIGSNILAWHSFLEIRGMVIKSLEKSQAREDVLRTDGQWLLDRLNFVTMLLDKEQSK